MQMMFSGMKQKQCKSTADAGCVKVAQGCSMVEFGAFADGIVPCYTAILYLCTKQVFISCIFPTFIMNWIT